jgi:hypothetical protein
MKYRVMGLILLSSVSTIAAADSLDLNLRDQAARLTYTAEMNTNSFSGLSGEVGLFYSEDKDQLDDTLFHAGLSVSGENWSQSGTFDISIGTRLYYTTPGNLDLSALAVGGAVRFSPVHRLGIGGNAYYAPDVTSFQDAKTFWEAGARIDYQLLPQAFVYVGYRHIEVDIENGPDNVELDDNAHVGIKMLF